MAEEKLCLLIIINSLFSIAYTLELSSAISIFMLVISYLLFTSWNSASMNDDKSLKLTAYLNFIWCSFSFFVSL